MRTGRVAVFLALLVTSSVDAPLAARAATKDLVQPYSSLSKQSIDEQVALRKDYGLASEDSLVASIASQPNAEVVLGILVTPEEAAGLRARGEAQTAIGAFKERVSAELPGYAGFYVDQEAGGVIVVMSTSRGSSAALNILRDAPQGVRARSVVVNSTMDELLALQAKVDGSRGALAAQGIVLNGVGVDVRANQVVAGVHPLTNDAARRLLDLFPGLVVVDEPAAQTASCVSRANCSNPLRAGIEVDFPGYGSCTSNFVASTGGTGSNVFLITAGHCAPKNAIAFHNGSVIGQATKWYWYQGGNSDSLAIDIAESLKSNLLYITNDSMISITARQSPTADYPGQIICQSGITSNVKCGTLWGGETQNFNGVVLYDVRRVTDLVVAHGDSGGPASVYQTGTASGIIMGSNYTPPPNARGWFTNIYYAERDLGLYVCRSMACTNF
ncbi:MAG TPA: hypothetical protein VFI15_05760 [Candidatus Limnocylindrales bacterium]|nr:hypothetical protein [Candidatus Limnocylindrales bacterium]